VSGNTGVSSAVGTYTKLLTCIDIPIWARIPHMHFPASVTHTYTNLSLAASQNRDNNTHQNQIRNQNGNGNGSWVLKVPTRPTTSHPLHLHTHTINSIPIPIQPRAIQKSHLALSLMICAFKKASWRSHTLGPGWGDGGRVRKGECGRCKDGV